MGHHLCDGHSVCLESAEALEASGVDNAHLTVSCSDSEVRPLNTKT